MSVSQSELHTQVDEITAGADSAGTALQRVCNLIRKSVDGCDWVGFYVVVPGKRELLLGPYAGEATEHLRIPFGRGICGQAAAKLSTIVVDDVSLESNYLSCSPNVKSEVVCPVFHNGELVGELDIDSHAPGAFPEDRRRLLEGIADRLGAQVAELMPVSPEASERG